jgi:hypothetical protein
VTGALLADEVSLAPDCTGSGPAQLENTMSPTITAARARPLLSCDPLNNMSQSPYAQKGTCVASSPPGLATVGTGPASQHPSEVSGIHHDLPPLVSELQLPNCRRQLNTDHGAATEIDQLSP